MTNNAAGAKGPCGGQVGKAGTHEGMTGKTGSNHPGGRKPAEQVRHLQRQLWVAAKRSPERRFHALMDRIWRGDVLQEAWRRVRSNRGSAGVDGETLVEIEQYGVERMLSELGEVLRAGRYRPQPVLRRYIPKADGRRRPLGIPTVRDRVVQMAATLVLEPIFEADFCASSYGFRPKRGWGQYFRTGNASRQFVQVDHYVAARLRGLLLKRYGAGLAAGRAAPWTHEHFCDLGLHRCTARSNIRGRRNAAL